MATAIHENGAQPGELVRLAALPGGVFQVKLNHPAKRNALSIELREAVAETLNRLAEDEECRGVILTGEGAAFCAGMDFTQFGGDHENKLKLLRSTRNLFFSVLEFPEPIIAAVNGAAVGGGFMLALCCDERVAVRDAFFGFFEVKRGIPAPYEVVRLFVGDRTAADWCETGRRIDVSEAQERGIVDEVTSPDSLKASCEKRARQRDGRKERLGLRAALAGEMEKFERALFPET